MTLKGRVLFAIFFFAFGIYNLMHAQSSFEEYKRRAFEQFDRFKTEKQQEFDAYRARVNREYEEYMRKAWQEYTTEPAIPVPKSPEPPQPEVVPSDAVPENKSLPKGEVRTAPKPTPAPMPLLPKGDLLNKPVSPVKRAPELSFSYYGTPCKVPFDKSLRFTLRSVDENSVADAWRQLSNRESVDLVRQCVSLRDSMKLSDWGYLRFAEKLAAAAYPGRKNEATLLQMFILAQSGYNVRIARTNEQLIALIPCKKTIYNYTYIPIEGMKYYILEPNLRSTSFKVFNHEFPYEKTFSLDINQQPKLDYDAGDTRHFRSNFDSAIDLNLAVNRNLIDFYNDYPLSSDWNIYANASLSEDVKSHLYPILQTEINGKSKTQAANMLLHFLQTAFEYMTDDKQFGIERALFPDETFFYPFSDCEDRAILYSVLIRDLLGLDVVLLHYPGHLASAVNFDEHVEGNYFELDGKRFTVCDPTYINANIGMAMPQFINVRAEIIKL